MRVISIGCPARGAEARFGLFDAVPAPHAHLVAAFAGVKLFIGEIELLATEGADVVLWCSSIIYCIVLFVGDKER